ncbi:MAG: pyridoxamine 5'-phosphate oxidase family protein [Prevotella sp.]|jgi:nitroimidazol reductase NimA-like FMN-containing flavoprotein (pyridoxamine 5'-phosphate oxidase superfamily)|nr:pyridoxamine 5'-phosphate oxidase family protein [Prevotella sp.]
MITIETEEKAQIEEIIRKCKVCHVGLIDAQGLPYVVPMNFGYAEGIIYLHSAPSGRKIDAARANPQVCITFSTAAELAYQHEEVACSYRMKGGSVICRGQAVFEENYEEKVKALDCIMRQYTEKKFRYSAPSVNNVKIWKIEIAGITARIFGAPHPKAVKLQGDAIK